MDEKRIEKKGKKDGNIFDFFQPQNIGFRRKADAANINTRKKKEKDKRIKLHNNNNKNVRSDSKEEM